MSLLLALAVFFIYFILDGAWAYYTWQTQAMNSVRAAVAASVIYGLSAFGVLVYVEEPLYLIAGAFGCFFGTYVIIEYQRRKSKKPDGK